MPILWVAVLWFVCFLREMVRVNLRHQQHIFEPYPRCCKVGVVWGNVSEPIERGLSPTASSCVTACKKAPPLALAPPPAPPPVPPRSASKPFISVTVQSSTESAQDTYLDGPADGQSGRSGGDPPATPPRNEALKSSAPPASAAARPDPLPKRKLSSIGIQVGGACL